MKKVSVSLEDEHIAMLEEREEHGDADSRSEALRDVLDEYEAVRNECQELRNECESLRNRQEDLRKQLREANRTNDRVEEIVEYVEEEKSLQERRQERESAPVWRRAKWWALGYPDDRER